MHQLELQIERGEAVNAEFALPLRTPEELRLFVLATFGVRIPNKKICAHHRTPWEAFRDAYFAKDEIAVWKASRGAGGKSFLLSLLGVVEAITLKADVNVLGGSGEQAARILETMGRLWGYENAPRHLLKSEPGRRETRLSWGNMVRGLMASQRSVRGPHPQRLRIDEADEMDLALFDAAMGQPMSANGVPTQTVASSTHQYPDGTMTELLKRAREREWPVYEWCYRETCQPHGWLEPSEINRMRRRMTVDMWNREMENQEPFAGTNAIDLESIARVFRRDLGEVEGAFDEELVFENPSDDRRVQYCHGADWAKDVDYTDIVTMLRNALPKPRVVSYLRTGRKRWPIMVGAFEDRLTRYPGAAAHDATGIGGPLGDYLTHDAEGVVLSSNVRKKIISDYIAAIENGEFESPHIETVVREHRRMTAKVFTGEEHLPDSVAAFALCWYAHQNGPPLDFRVR